MENEADILRLGEMNIIEYLNKMHVSSDKCQVETERATICKFSRQLNNYLHLVFVENCESLLVILDTYKYCYSLLEGLHSPLLPHTEEVAENVPQMKALRQAFVCFEDNIEPFLTKNRYLVCVEKFHDYCCILTNDLLFIGEAAGTESYKLKNALPRSVLRVERSCHSLTINAGAGVAHVLKGDEETIDEFYFTLCGEAEEEKHEMERASRGVDQAYVKYLLNSDQFQELKDYLDSLDCLGTVCFKDLGEPRIGNAEDLKILMEIAQEPSQVFIGFARERLSKGLNQINRMQKAEDLICDVFDFLECFVERLEDVVKKIGLDRMTFILCLEQLMLQAFKALDRRIFNKFYEIAISNSNIELVKGRLKFKQFDFSYLIDMLESRREEFSKECLKEAKKMIERELSGL